MKQSIIFSLSVIVQCYQSRNNDTIVINFIVIATYYAYEKMYNHMHGFILIMKLILILFCDVHIYVYIYMCVILSTFVKQTLLVLRSCKFSILSTFRKTLNVKRFRSV